MHADGTGIDGAGAAATGAIINDKACGRKHQRNAARAPIQPEVSALNRQYCSIFGAAAPTPAHDTSPHVNSVLPAIRQTRR